MIGLAERYTILIVTHNMQQAARVSSRTGFFLKGELVEIADTKLIFNSPKDQRTLDYVSGKFG
jgi:phosphate transport system ATP-binding protein